MQKTKSQIIEIWPHGGYFCKNKNFEILEKNS